MAIMSLTSPQLDSSLWHISHVVMKVGPFSWSFDSDFHAQFEANFKAFKMLISPKLDHHALQKASNRGLSRLNHLNPSIITGFMGNSVGKSCMKYADVTLQLSTQLLRTSKDFKFGATLKYDVILIYFGAKILISIVTSSVVTQISLLHDHVAQQKLCSLSMAVRLCKMSVAVTQIFWDLLPLFSGLGG